MGTPLWDLRVPELPHQAIGAFRSMAEAELSIPRMTARGVACRMEIPWHLTVRRRIQAILNFESKKEKKENPN